MRVSSDSEWSGELVEDRVGYEALNWFRIEWVMKM